MKSGDLKVEGLAWLRYVQHMPVVCTEVQYVAWNPDIIGISPQLHREIEVKVSSRDFKMEFVNKKSKIFSYANAKTPGAETTSMSGIPNFFYYLVPEPMAKEVLETTAEKIPQAGVLSVADFSRGWGRNIKIERRPKKLHESKPKKAMLHAAFLRLGSELVNQKIMQRELVESFDDLVKKMDASATLRGLKEAETVLTPEGFYKTAERLLAYVVDDKAFDDLPQERQEYWRQKADKMLQCGSRIPETWALALE